MRFKIIGAGVLIAGGAWLAAGAELRGNISDSRTGEPLRLVSVRLVGAAAQSKTETDAAGGFEFANLAPGNYWISASTVGYHLLAEAVHVDGAGGKAPLNLALTTDSFEHRDAVDVHDDPYDAGADRGPTAFSLSGSEAKNLSSVLAQDPLRAVQTIPGVTADDDFDSRFSLHGADYARIGLYLDGILLHQPFHTVQGAGPSGATAVFSGDMVADMTVESEGYGPQFEDRTGGVLAIASRDGSGDGFHWRATVSVPDASVLAEGPLGKHKGSWLVSERKSYLQYFLSRLAQDLPAEAFGYSDTEAKLTYAFSGTHAVSVEVVDGVSSLNGSAQPAALGLNVALRAAYRYTLANLAWSYTPGSSFVAKTHVAFMRERFDDGNAFHAPLAQGFYGEWVAKSDAAWSWSDNARLQFGAEGRSTRGDGIQDYYFTQAASTTTQSYGGKAVLAGGYVRQSWTSPAKRLTLHAGGRWDRISTSGIAAWSPQAAIAFQPWSPTRWSVSWSRYAQFPDINSLFVTYGTPGLLPQHSDQVAVTWEQRLGTLTRLRVEAFERKDRNLVFQPFENARLLADGQIEPDQYQSPLFNSLLERSKGLEFFLQRRTANGWTGWLSYTFNESEAHDRVTGLSFPADEDQRHSANAYLSYRVRPSVNVSAKFVYGSGFPVPGFFQLENGQYFLAAGRNGVRLPAYERLDLRLNKSKALKRGKLTYYVEATNVLNHANYRFDSYNGFDAATGQASVSLLKMFPILPSAGLMIEF